MYDNIISYFDNVIQRFLYCFFYDYVMYKWLYNKVYCEIFRFLQGNFKGHFILLHDNITVYHEHRMYNEKIRTSTYKDHQAFSYRMNKLRPLRRLTAFFQNCFLE